MDANKHTYCCVSLSAIVQQMVVNLQLSKWENKNQLHTHANAQVVTNLQRTCSNVVPTTCQQDVFALLVPSLLTSCQQLVGNLKQGYWTQQTCYKLFQQLVIVLQFDNKMCSHNLTTRCVRNRLVASLSTSCNNAVILSSCYNHNLFTQFVNKLDRT
jgi:hypothetical protein